MIAAAVIVVASEEGWEMAASPVLLALQGASFDGVLVFFSERFMNSASETFTFLPKLDFLSKEEGGVENSMRPLCRLGLNIVSIDEIGADFASGSDCDKMTSLSAIAGEQSSFPSALPHTVVDDDDDDDDREDPAGADPGDGADTFNHSANEEGG